jgi:uncharacterized protein YjbJ (UPF0337 family)
MAIEDKARNTLQDTTGAAKEAAGRLTGNESLEHEGRKDRAAAALKDAGENAKDAAGDIGDSLRNAAQKLKEGFSNK